MLGYIHLTGAILRTSLWPTRIFYEDMVQDIKTEETHKADIIVSHSHCCFNVYDVSPVSVVYVLHLLVVYVV